MRYQGYSKIIAVAGLALSAALLTPMEATAQEGPNDVEPSKNLVLKGIGSFFMGGNTHYVESPYSYNSTRPGNVMINQMYVQFMKPAKNNNQWPIVFVHGCCLSSKSWQTTPDGRMGWDEYFVRQGFDVYLADQVGRARSGFNGLQYQKVRYGDAPGETNPEIRLPTDNFAWAVFRWGDYATLTPYPDVKFPMETVGVGPGSNLSFYKQVIPDMTATLDTSPEGCSGGGCYVDDVLEFHNTSQAMSDLANELGGAILVGHSQSSSFPTRSAFQEGSGCFPWTSEEACKVQGIIQIETGCFGDLAEDEIETLSHIPILIIRGDYYSEPVPQSCYDMQADVNGAGGDMKIASMPNLVPDDLYPGSPGPMPGIEHMMMIGTQNIEVADILLGWIDEHVANQKGH